MPKSMSVRFSSGSSPRNHDPSSLTLFSFNTEGDDARRDVGRIQHVVRQGRRRVFRRRGPVHEDRRAEGRRADRVDSEKHPRALDRALVRAAERHEQVVRMLVVDERRLLERFAGLEDLRRSERLNGERLERQHPTDADTAVARRPRARPHEPVLRLDLVEIGEGADLIVEAGEDLHVPGPRPGRFGGRRAVAGVLILRAGRRADRRRGALRTSAYSTGVRPRYNDAPAVMCVNQRLGSDPGTGTGFRANHPRDRRVQSMQAMRSSKRPAAGVPPFY